MSGRLGYLAEILDLREFINTSVPRECWFAARTGLPCLSFHRVIIEAWLYVVNLMVCSGLQLLGWIASHLTIAATRSSSVSYCASMRIGVRSSFGVWLLDLDLSREGW